MDFLQGDQDAAESTLTWWPNCGEKPRSPLLLKEHALLTNAAYEADLSGIQRKLSFATLGEAFTLSPRKLKWWNRWTNSSYFDDDEASD